MIALCGGGDVHPGPSRALRKARNDVLVRHGGSQLASFIACSADGVSSMAMPFVCVIRTLGFCHCIFGEARFCPLHSLAFPDLTLSSHQFVSLSSSPKRVFPCAQGPVWLFVRWCSTAENDVIFRDRRLTCRAFCAWLRAVAGVSHSAPRPSCRRC